jgi:hypothetical protein
LGILLMKARFCGDWVLSLHNSAKEQTHDCQQAAENASGDGDKN